MFQDKYRIIYWYKYFIKQPFDSNYIKKRASCLKNKKFCAILEKLLKQTITPKWMNLRKLMK